ncbi:hypothetical protein HPP92_007891 [Vanilla planifolia]|uniref:Protein EARLY HEADING DATE 2 n=1 Tax=Vanilla planifolia TaxID=51239 RepID=A0A835RB99_VANPL|nr:hypothetical protein HPP92_007891 [Vanilla planifolia]
MTMSNSVSGEVSVSSGHHQGPAAPPPPKKRRNLPGMPDPNAEVIALSPKTLLATNRFVCEICNKGFQRDQNLQLHRRGHNLPWKLRQRTGKEVQKKVYVCPEPSCVHHDPSRALGDLTGIKKHFCRKHGEKKWKCDKCTKKYAVHSDWKAHAKTCGTREYRCDCGTLFSRRDSFITHRAFCDALAEESARSHTDAIKNPPEEKETKVSVTAALQDQIAPPQAERGSVVADGVLHYVPPPLSVSVSSRKSSGTTSGGSSNSGTTANPSVFPSLFAAACSAAAVTTQRTALSDLIGSIGRTECSTGGSLESPLLCLSSHSPASFFPQAPDRRQFNVSPAPSAHLSATALLQKAAQMGASSSSTSFLRGLGLSASSSATSGNISDGSDLHRRQPPLELQELSLPSAGLGLGLTFDSGVAAAALPQLIFGSKPATMDFLGLGMDPTCSAGDVGLSTFIRGGVDVCPGPQAIRRSEPAAGEGLGWMHSKTQ